MPKEQRNWGREETIVAFNLYCKIPFKESTKTNPQIIRLAKEIGRTPSAVAMKIGNLGSLDPGLRDKGISGLVNVSRLDKEIWDEFNGNWDKLAFESETILAKYQGYELADTAIDEQISALRLPDGTDRQTLIRARVNQAFFRQSLLTAYNSMCCVTRLATPQLLVASHIIPWSTRTDTRTDPRNGLLLNSIYDKAFDAGLITINTSYEVRVSRHMHELLPNKVIKEWFIDYEGKGISLPEKFLPSIECLRWHEENVFKG